MGSSLEDYEGHFINNWHHEEDLRRKNYCLVILKKNCDDCEEEWCCFNQKFNNLKISAELK